MIVLRRSLAFCFKLRPIGLHQQNIRLFSKHHEEKHGDSEYHFGFQTVGEHEKSEKVHQVFENVAEKYDLMNDVMSVGIHRLWKDYFMCQLAPPSGTQLLDVAGGTGDIVFRFLSYIENEKYDSQNLSPDNPFDVESVIVNSSHAHETSDKHVSENMEHTSSDTDRGLDDTGHVTQTEQLSHVTVCDLSESMLENGKKRAENLKFSPSDITWVHGNAEDLPFEDDKFDAYTISFGIRNCVHVDTVLREAYRVLKPGGRFMCLEFSSVNNSLLRQLYDGYSLQMIPVMGQVFARDWRSYQYLVESIRRFPPQQQFADMITDAGFKMVRYENLTFGVAAIHSAYKL